MLRDKNHKGKKALRSMAEPKRSNKVQNFEWYELDDLEYAESVSTQYVKLKNPSFKLNTDYIVEYGSDFERLNIEKNQTKNTNASILDSTNKTKYKNVINGTLYFRSKSKDLKPAPDKMGDMRITYYQMVKKNKISILGEKYGNEIIPSSDIKGYDSYRIYRVLGERFSYDDFMEIIRKEGRDVYIAFQVISILLLMIGMPLMVWGCLDVKGQCRNQLR